MKFVKHIPRKKDEMRLQYLVYENGTIYLEAEDRDGWWSDLTSECMVPVGENEIVLNHDLIVPGFKDIIDSLVSCIAVSTREVFVGPMRAKSLALTLKENWRDECVAMEV